MKFRTNRIKKHWLKHQRLYLWLICAASSFFFARARLFGGIGLFAPALLCACASLPLPLPAVILGSTIGILSRLATRADAIAHLLPFLLLALLLLFLKKKNRRLGKHFLPLLIPLLHLLPAVFLPFLTYERIMYVISILISSVCVDLFSGALASLLDIRKKRRQPPAAAVSLALFTGILLSGIASVSVGSGSLGAMLCVACTLLAAFLCGAEAAAATGALIGLPLCLQWEQLPFLCAVLALSGVITGALARYKKYLSAFLFTASYAILTLLFEGYILPVLAFTDLAGGLFLFLCIPRSAALGMEAFLIRHERVTSNTPKYYVQQNNIAMEEKLRGLSNIFTDMADMLDSGTVPSSVLHRSQCSEAMRRNVCSDCIRRRECELRSQLDELAVPLCKGTVEPAVLSSCIRSSELERTAARIRDAAQLQRMEQSVRTDERHLVAGELSAIAQLMKSMADDAAAENHFDERTERRIREEMSACGCSLKEVFVSLHANGRLCLTLIRDADKKEESLSDEYLSLISSICNRQMTVNMHTCSNDICIIRYEDAPRFSVNSGVARRTKTGSAMSGDNYTVRALGTQRCLIAVSDGMGSGRSASVQSEIAIELVEAFYQAGFEQEVTLDTINRLMMLRNTDESYATLDLCLIDRHSGTASFVKIGASGGYIKRGKHLIPVVPEALPLGITENLRPFCATATLQDNDFIILMSDGVSESSEADIADWLARSSSLNPQHMADSLMEYCLSRTNGRCPDDMTVIVSRIRRTDEIPARSKKRNFS